MIWRRWDKCLQRPNAPCLLLGGSMWTKAGHDAVRRFVEAHDLPVAVGFRRQGLFPHDHPNFIGSLGFGGIDHPNAYARSADLVIALGSRLNDPTTLKHSVIKAPRPDCKLIHIHPGAEELGRLYQADLPILADPNLAAVALADLPPVKTHGAQSRAARAAYETRLAIPVQAGPVDMADVMRVLNQRLPRETTMTTGAGNASDWPNIHYRYRQFLGAAAPVSGRDGHGGSCRCCRKTGTTKRPDRLYRRRRRLSDERARTGNRRAIRPARHFHYRGQRHVRHHSWQSRGALSRPPLWHDAAQP